MANGAGLTKITKCIVINFVEVEYPEGCTSSGWNITCGDKYAEQLCWEEMLGLVAALTIPQPPRCLEWIKTAEQWKALAVASEQRRVQRERELRGEGDEP